MAWLIALAAGMAGAALQYGARAPRWLLNRPAPVVLRALAYTLVVALLLDAPLGRGALPHAWVALDASASLARDGDAGLWTRAVDSARAIGGDSVYLFGDSLRLGVPPAVPADTRSDADAVVQRALATGRPVAVVSDGELADASEFSQLPAGSRVVVVARPPQRDVALAALDAPRAVVGGDSIQVTLEVAAGALGSGPGSIALALDGVAARTMRLDSLGAYQRRSVTATVRAPAREGPALLRAVVQAPGDAEPRNDTLQAGLDVSRQPGAVFVSTSPDYDARYAVAVLRGALSLPTRAFYHLSPGNWRLDGGFARATEREVREAFRDAPVAVLQGDTAVFGPPRLATHAPLALIVPVQGDGNEWYAAAGPASPLSGALAGALWDSLPPLLAGPGPEPTGQWRALVARRGRELTSRTIIAGDDSPRRVVMIAASDLWRWQFRGGAASDVYTALWGSIFDFLASARADQREAVPSAGVLRAGVAVAWRRGGMPAGAAPDSSVPVVLQRRGGGAPDTVRLLFAPGTATAESPPLPAGVYDVRATGGTSLLVVNASAEWLPAAPVMTSARVGGAPLRAPGRSSRDTPWMYVLLVTALCAEWLLRRRAGLR